MSAAVPILTTAEVAAGQRVSPRTVLTWILAGVTVGGERVRLAGHRAGGRWRVTAAALEQFLRRCNPQQPAEAANPTADRRRWASDQKRLASLLDSS